MAPGDYGTKAVPTYVSAEAETTPLPKITVPEPSPRPRSPGRGLGDLPMRVVYRVLAGFAAVAVLGTVAAVVLLSRDDAGPRVAAGAGSAGPASVPVASVPATIAATAATAGTVSSPLPTGVPGEDSSAMDAALSDPRVPALPARDRKLRTLPGHTTPTRGLIRDRRSGVAFPRFAKVWKLAPANPFASRQMLPKVAGLAFPGLLVSCPVPIPVQQSMRDTAFLAARWTLNHHPSGATITWTASQPITIEGRDGWLLGYHVNYTIKGKKRMSMAALALVDVPGKKPALVFVTVPDRQKSRWHDINKVMSTIRVL